ncbi:hypothetical protein D3C81_2000770 [compost metagenome]
MPVYEVYQLVFVDGDGASFEEKRSDNCYLSKGLAEQKCQELLDSDLGWFDIRVATLRVND